MRNTNRYSVAGSWDVFKRTGGGAEHVGPDTPLMRRVHGVGSLGPVFWLGDKVPLGFEHFGYPTYLDSQAIDAVTRADASAYLAALVDAEPTSDFGQPNERAVYVTVCNFLCFGGPASKECEIVTLQEHSLWDVFEICLH
jgi:hypothetical protein